MKQGSGSVRGDILSAAEQLILEEGLGAATTRAIAKAAGCAEGSIYRHFPDKDALVVEVAKTCFPEFIDMLCTLPSRVGVDSVPATLEEVGRVALTFYRGILPITAGVIADQELLSKNRESFRETGHGPAKACEAVSGYLAAEQVLGRVNAQVPALSAARMLLGAFFSQAFFEELTGEEQEEGDAENSFVGSIIEVLWRALAPDPTKSGGVLC